MLKERLPYAITVVVVFVGLHLYIVVLIFAFERTTFLLSSNTQQSLNRSGLVARSIFLTRGDSWETTLVEVQEGYI